MKAFDSAPQNELFV